MIDRVLIVEDRELDAKLASVLLIAAGFEVAFAADLDAARAALDTFSPHLVLVDLRLPGGHGLDLVRAIRMDPARASVAVVVVTASAMTSDEVRAVEAGCDDYIPKPLDTNTFAARVDDCLERVRSDFRQSGSSSTRATPRQGTSTERPSVAQSGNELPAGGAPLRASLKNLQPHPTRSQR